MTGEYCQECDFDGATWTDTAATAVIRDLPARWARALGDVPGEDLIRRIRSDRWSIVEYADHVGAVLAAMRGVVAAAIAQPGIDLGGFPEPVFEPEPRAIDIDQALSQIECEAIALADRLGTLTPGQWDAQVIGNGETVDVHWIARHAVHDATHHLLDIQRLRAMLTSPS